MIKARRTAYIALFATVFLFSHAASAQNLGFYEKIAEDSLTSTYELVWSTFDSGAYNEPILPGDFLLPPPDENGCVEGLCPFSAGIEELDRIIVVAKRPAFMVWGFVSSGGGGTRVGRDEQFGGLGSGGPLGYVRIGNIAITAQQLADLANSVHQLTIDWALVDIQTFRQTGLHHPNPIGSMIPWQVAQVNWNLYGAANPNFSDQDVFDNFIDALINP